MALHASDVDVEYLPHYQPSWMWAMWLHCGIITGMHALRWSWQCCNIMTQSTVFKLYESRKLCIVFELRSIDQEEQCQSTVITKVLFFKNNIVQ
jgi:hypothetical protein